MTSSIEHVDAARRRKGDFKGAFHGALAGVGTALRHVLAWPARVHCARQVMLQLGRMGDHELRDIGLTRFDLHDANAQAFYADPSLALRRRVEERRRRR